MDTPSLLEQRYPHIVQGVLASWHDIDTAERYLSSVLVDGRDGREGLPEDAFAELLFLSELNWKRRHFNHQGVEFHPDNFSFGWT
jgi:hypothetical protein